MNKETAEIICRALLAIVAALRKQYGLPEYHGITIQVNDSVASAAIYENLEETANPKP